MLSHDIHPATGTANNFIAQEKWVKSSHHFTIINKQDKTYLMLNNNLIILVHWKNLHFKSQLLHFFKEITDNETLDKIWIEVVFDAFCSSKLLKDNNQNSVLFCNKYTHSLQTANALYNSRGYNICIRRY